MLYVGLSYGEPAYGSVADHFRPDPGIEGDIESVIQQLAIFGFLYVNMPLKGPY